jgi:hypothetical protein
MHPAPVIVKRILLSLLIGLVIGVLINEVTFLSLRETARAPKVIELVIPEGTADSIARGETPPSIPNAMTFVVGDTLLVRNNDTSDHELGPLWIPAGSSASLPMDAVQSYAYGCSFQEGNYFGLDVREPLTFSTRLYGVLYSGVPLGMLIALYAVIMPTKKKNDSQKNVQP